MEVKTIRIGFEIDKQPLEEARDIIKEINTVAKEAGLNKRQVRSIVKSVITDKEWRYREYLRRGGIASKPDTKAPPRPDWVPPYPKNDMIKTI